eukprot:TRINITY_DN27089_c0_g1_i3.p1 TRINITY_DN27089_c0_g1~~TRINITY_DN27089_c0_g1_i3.p1  ORF type:complete len:463 (-),score=57.44 TRINITY_DN27089_c0_g1_i3:154-1542(-)
MPRPLPLLRRGSYTAVPTAELFDELGGSVEAENTDGGGPELRREWDFDGDGVVDDFELRFGVLLERAKAGKTVDLGSDVWGCAVYTIVVDLPVLLARKMKLENVMRFVSVMGVLALNLGLQFGLLYWIAVYVMMPSIRATQDTYHGFHDHVFSPDGVYEPSQFDSFASRDSLCQFPLFDEKFTFAVLFLWSAQCFIEIRSSQRIFSGLASLPTLPQGICYTHMIHVGLQDSYSDILAKKLEEVVGHISNRKNVSLDTSQMADAMKIVLEMYGETSKRETNYHLVCLTPLTRAAVYCLVLVPRLGIILLLMLVGSIWLTATARFDSLILNALALEFIVEVDNLLFTLVFPISLHQQVEGLKVAMPVCTAKKTGVLTLHHLIPRTSDEVHGYFRSMGYLLGVFAFVVIFRFYQPVLPGFKGDLSEACTPYIASWTTPKYGLQQLSRIWECVVGRDNCFPYGGDG